jgi:hypothetical protein
MAEIGVLGRWQELRDGYQCLIERDERRIATSKDFIEYYRAGIANTKPVNDQIDHNMRVGSGLLTTRCRADVMFARPPSGNDQPPAGLTQIPLSCRLTLPIWQCSGAARIVHWGPFARMLRTFFRLVTCSPWALVGALSVGALIAVASAERAVADDILTTKTPASPFPGPAYNWNGFYAGGQLGYAWGSSNWTASSPGAPNVSGSFGLGQRAAKENPSRSRTWGRSCCLALQAYLAGRL